VTNELDYAYALRRVYENNSLNPKTHKKQMVNYSDYFRRLIMCVHDMCMIIMTA